MRVAEGHDRNVIRNAVIHLNNEQPMLADLFERPAAGDLGLVCTNVRDMAGKRPLFIDDSQSVFFFPYTHIRFLEILPGSDGAPELEAGSGNGTARRRPHQPAPEPVAEAEADLEIDEDFLRRIRDV